MGIQSVPKILIEKNEFLKIQRNLSQVDFWRIFAWVNLKAIDILLHVKYVESVFIWGTVEILL